MHRTMLNLVVLVALCWPGHAFLQDLLPHLNLNPQQQYPQQYPQYQYRRAAYEPQPQAQPVQYGYAYSRPAFYQQWLPAARPAYEAGTAYSYAGSANPISTFLQGSWLPWSSNRQPVVQQQQPQLSSQYVSSQPQQPQQPQQPIWGLLPWGGSSAQQGGNGNPVLTWLQHPLQLPWGQQQQQHQQQQAVYTTPLAPAAPAAPAVSTLHVVTAEAPVAAAPLPSSSSVIKPEGVVLEGQQYQQLPAISSNAIRRVTLEHEHADGQPCV